MRTATAARNLLRRGGARRAPRLPRQPDNLARQETIDPNRHSLYLCVADINADGTGTTWWPGAPGTGEGPPWTRYPFTASITTPDTVRCRRRRQRAWFNMNGDGRLDVLGRSSPTTGSGVLPARERRRPRRGRAFGSSQPILSIHGRVPARRLRPHPAASAACQKTTSAEQPNTDRHLYQYSAPRTRRAPGNGPISDTAVRRGRARRRLRRGRVARVRREHQAWTTMGGIGVWLNTLGGGCRRPAADPSIPHGRGRADTDQHNQDAGGGASYAYQWLRYTQHLPAPRHSEVRSRLDLRAPRAPRFRARVTATRNECANTATAVVQATVCSRRQQTPGCRC